MLLATITATNVSYLQDTIGSYIPFEEFNLNSKELLEEDGDSITYQLFNDNELIYKGTYNSLTMSVYEDIESSLSQLVKLKQIKKSEQRHLLKLLKGSKEQHNVKKQPDKKENTPMTMKKWLIVGGVASVIAAGSIWWSFPTIIPKFQEKISQPSSQESFDHLVSKGKYLEALNNQHASEDITEVVNELVEQKKFEQLKDVQKAYPTALGAFNLAFFEKNWLNVLDTPLDFYSETEQEMLTYATIQLGTLSTETKKKDIEQVKTYLSDATKLLKTLKTNTLETALSQAYFLNGVYFLERGDIKEAQALAKNISHQDYLELLATAKILVERIESLKKDKKNDEAENWTTVLSTIGKEYRQDNDTK